MLVRQGLVAEAMDALEDLAGAGFASPVEVDLDDAGRVTVQVEFDPTLVESLARLPGAARDKDAGLWRVGRAGQPALVDLLERLARPPCSPVDGCTLGEDAPPSSVHRDAHERGCA
jgi:hypothetical protein